METGTSTVIANKVIDDALAKVWKKVIVFLGTTRDVRLGDRVAKFVVTKLEKKAVEVVVVDPLKFNLPLLTKPVHYYKPPDKPPQKLIDMNCQIKEADAIVVVSSEYNHSIPPGLTNTMDYFSPESFAYKPSAIVTYSPSMIGGARAGVQLRAFLGALGCISVSAMFNIPRAHLALDDDGNPTKNTDEGKHMDRHCDHLLDQLQWWADAARVRRLATGIELSS